MDYEEKSDSFLNKFDFKMKFSSYHAEMWCRSSRESAAAWRSSSFEILKTLERIWRWRRPANLYRAAKKEVYCIAPPTSTTVLVKVVVGGGVSEFISADLEEEKSNIETIFREYINTKEHVFKVWFPKIHHRYFIFKNQYNEKQHFFMEGGSRKE